MWLSIKRKLFQYHEFEYEIFVSLMEEVQIRKNRALFYLSVLWDDSSSAEKSRGVSLGLDPLSWLL